MSSLQKFNRRTNQPLVGGTGDQYFSNVSLLLNGDGSNGSTTFTDLSSTPKTVTASGNARISTSTKKFGTGSIYFDGNGDYLSVAASTSFILDSDFTVECWVNVSAIAAYPRIFSFGSHNAPKSLGLEMSSSSYLSWYNGSIINWGSVASLNAWHHIAMVRYGSTMTLYVDGIALPTTITSATTEINTGQPLYIGSLQSYEADTNAAFNGYIDDFRVTKGVARYTANFAPPTQTLPTYTYGMLVGTLANPATDIAALRSAGITTNGMYYFKNATSGATTFQAYCKFNYIDGNDWYLLLKVHNQGDMTSGSTYWTNTSLYNESDSNLTSGTWSKYATWNYVPFTRVMMEMTQGGTAKIPPIMIYDTSRTFAQAITAAGTPGVPTGLLCNSTDPVIPANARYWDMPMKSGTNFTDANGMEDYIQGYGIGSWANNSQNSTTAEGFTSIGRAGAWIGCPLDEGNHTFNNASNSGADSGFGFGGGCGNTAKTFSAGYAEWSLASSTNTLPGYVWVR